MKTKWLEGIVNDILEDIHDQLPDLARELRDAEGRGALWFDFDAEESDEPGGLTLRYIHDGEIPPYRYLARLIDEYEPDTECVVVATKGDTWLTYHVGFEPVSDWSSQSELG